MHLGCVGIKDGDAGGVGAEQSWAARLLLNEPSDGHEQIDCRRHAPSERLRRNLDAGAREARALPLDRQMLDELVAHGLDDQTVRELAVVGDDRYRVRAVRLQCARDAFEMGLAARSRPTMRG